MGTRRQSRIVSEDGVPCPRCGRPTQIREHVEIKPKHRAQPFYYSRWYNCAHDDCATTLIMREEFKVWNDNDAAHTLQQRLAPPGDSLIDATGDQTGPPPWE